MFADDKAALAGDLVLPGFDFGVVELFHPAAIDTNQMVVVFAAIDFEHGLAAFEIVPFQQAGLLELGQYAVDGGEPDIDIFIDQNAIDVFGCEMAHVGTFEQLENFQSGYGGFEAFVLEALWIAHLLSIQRPGGWGEFGYDITLRISKKSCLQISMAPCRILLIAALAGFGLSACTSYVPRIVTEYRIDVQQGNVLNQEMVAQLKPGQTREQVRYILGTPLLTDMFHASRWDYVYRFREGKTNAVQTRRLTVFFDQEGLLEKVTGDVEPAQVADLTGPVARTQVIDLGTAPEGQALPPPEQKGFFGRMLEKVGL